LQAYDSELSFPQLFQTLGKVSRSTLERWRKDLEEAEYDYHVLAPKWGKHRSGTTKLTEHESRILFTQVFHQNRVKTGTAITVTKYILELEGLPSPSSPATMRRAVDQFQRQHFDLWTFYREGEKALVDKVLPFIERDDSLIDVGDVLVADGHRCNFRVKNPWTGKPCRPMLVGFYDWKSRILCGWSISLEENTQLITSALRNAIIRLGKTPKIILLDNGAAFKSKVFTGDIDLEQSGIRGMFARLDIKTVFAWPYNARSKPIERFFGDFSNQFERYMPSFSGASITDKPASMMRNEKLMQAYYKENVMEIPHVMAALEKWWDFHAWTDHPTLKGQQKGQVFESGRGTGIDQGKLNDLMMDMAIKRLGRNGVSFLGGDYFHEALYGLREQVVIRYDFCDITSIHVYAKNGDYICQAPAVQGKLKPHFNPHNPALV
jgi:putative transposase